MYPSIFKYIHTNCQIFKNINIRSYIQISNYSDLSTFISIQSRILDCQIRILIYKYIISVFINMYIYIYIQIHSKGFTYIHLYSLIFWNIHRCSSKVKNAHIFSIIVTYFPISFMFKHTYVFLCMYMCIYIYTYSYTYIHLYLDGYMFCIYTHMCVQT